MRIFRNLKFLAISFIALYQIVESQDIADDRKYGCTWHGGSMAKLSCNCENGAEMTIKADSINSFSTSEILINGCKSVKMEANAVADMRNLRALSLSKIGNIQLDTDSINWYGYKENSGQIEEERFDITVPSLKVNVYKSNISQIQSHAFAGRISEITFEDVNVERLDPLAFVNLLQTEKISIRDSVLRNVGVQSFKKFSTEYVELINVHADLVPSRAFSNITVYQNFTIENCTFDTVYPGGFTVYNPLVFQVTNTNVKDLNGEAFKVISRGRVIFRNNNFTHMDDGALRGITFRKDMLLGESLFAFDSNRLGKLSSGALSVSEPNVQFKNIYLGDCDCSDTDQKIKDSSYYEDLQCRSNNEFMTVKYFKAHMCSVASNYYIIIIIVCVVGTLVIALISGLVLYYKFVYRVRKYGDKKSEKKGNLSLIVPDGRTYRETELHVIVERTDLLTTDL